MGGATWEESGLVAMDSEQEGKGMTTCAELDGVLKSFSPSP